jgi:hypothetical protein
MTSLDPQFIAGMRAGLEAAARRYDGQRASIERSLAVEKDKREQDRYRVWVQDNQAHAAGLRGMAEQFDANPNELLAVMGNDKPPPDPDKEDMAHLAKLLLRKAREDDEGLLALFSNNLNTIIAALDRASAADPEPKAPTKLRLATNASLHLLHDELVTMSADAVIVIGAVHVQAHELLVVVREALAWREDATDQ